MYKLCNYWKIVLTIFIFSIILFSCETNENGIDSILDSEVVDSKEFDELNITFETIERMEVLVYRKSKSAIEKKIISKELYRDYTSNITKVNTSNKEIRNKGTNEIIEFYKLIGIDKPDEFYKKREQILEKSLPKLTIALGEKYPELKKLSNDELDKLFIAYNSRKNEK